MVWRASILLEPCVTVEFAGKSYVGIHSIGILNFTEHDATIALSNVGLRKLSNLGIEVKTQ